IRDIFVTDGQYVNSGDDIISIELLSNFYIDITIDPVDINGNLKNKRIRYRSLVDSFTGSATIFKTSRAYKPDEVSSGLRLVTLLIHGKWEELSNNLDTAFEIFIDDKDKN
ncbi:TPA: hypothetical protein JTJ58_005007, partial [Escherichia coli]|nr:hypothetical protein [Escherichia coli]